MIEIVHDDRMSLGNPSETGSLKIDIYEPREAADLVVVHDLAYPEMHNTILHRLDRRKYYRYRPEKHIQRITTIFPFAFPPSNAMHASLISEKR